MFNSNSFIAAISAILISSACVATAVGPAAAFERGGTDIAAIKTPVSAQAAA